MPFALEICVDTLRFVLDGIGIIRYIVDEGTAITVGGQSLRLGGHF